MNFVGAKIIIDSQKAAKQSLIPPQEPPDKVSASQGGEIVRQRSPHASMVLVGSKVDREGDRLVLPAEGQSLAADSQWNFAEVHARDHFGVKHLFFQVIRPQMAGDLQLRSWMAHSLAIWVKWCEFWQSMYNWCLTACVIPVKKTAEARFSN